MSDLEGSSWSEIDAPVERCFEIVADVERAPAWHGAMQSVRVLERDADGRPLLVETHMHAIVASVAVWLRFEYSEPTSVRWTRERGDLKSLTGGWELEALDAGRTRATYSLQIGRGRSLGLLRKAIRGPAETKIRELLADRPIEGLRREAER